VSPRLHVALVSPEIPQNTGNVARTCAATGAVLHLVHPLGFAIDERAVRRAGLDYWDLVEIREHPSLDDFLEACSSFPLFLFSARGSVPHTAISYPPDAVLVFGKESTGLPAELLAAHGDTVARIPVREETRSLNLSNAVAVGVYEVLRQWGYPALSTKRLPRSAS
jgi:tRNA (cytidine/uridine-2'-O-)-methyltransferase